MYCHSAYLTYMQSTSYKMPAQAGIKIDNLRYSDDTTLVTENEVELMMKWNLNEVDLMKVKQDSEKAGLKLNIEKTQIMASGPISSWQIDGETMETVTDFIFLGFKITANGDFSHEIKRHLVLGRKAMTNLDSILRKQGRQFVDKGLFSQGYDFSSSHVWM